MIQIEEDKTYICYCDGQLTWLGHSNNYELEHDNRKTSENYDSYCYNLLCADTKRDIFNRIKDENYIIYKDLYYCPECQRIMKLATKERIKRLIVTEMMKCNKLTKRIIVLKDIVYFFNLDIKNLKLIKKLINKFVKNNINTIDIVIDIIVDTIYKNIQDILLSKNNNFKRRIN